MAICPHLERNTKSQKPSKVSGPPSSTRSRTRRKHSQSLRQQNNNQHVRQGNDARARRDVHQRPDRLIAPNEVGRTP